MSNDSEREFRNVFGESIESAHGPSRRSVLRSVGLSAGIAGSGLLSGALPATAEAAAASPTCKPARDGGSSLPGPAVLRDSPATAPQFENADGWEADPLLVSGANAYIDGEFLSQDFVYDDYGANTTNLPLPPNPEPGGEVQSELLPTRLAEELPNLDSVGDSLGMLFGAATGDVVYPTDEETYRHNAADLLEFRTRPVQEDGKEKVTYRITLNTMTEAGVAAAAIGIDRSAPSGNDGGDEGDGPLLLDEVTETVDRTVPLDETLGDGSGTDWGYGLGKLGVDLDNVLVTWGEGAELDGEALPADAVSVSERRNQIDVTVPLAPGEETWRHYLVVGLFDEEDEEFVQIQELPDETHPGGEHLGDPPPVFNVGFRSAEQEPMGSPNIEPGMLAEELEETLSNVGSRGIGYGHWREHAQATALTERDISPFHADIDFGKLQSGVTERNVPETGYISRLYASRYDFEDADVDFEPGEGIDGEANVITGQVQPYALYVPESYDPDQPTPFLLNLHSLFTTYNEYGVLMPDQIEQLAEQRNSLMLIPEGRGSEGWWRGGTELDAFEAWSDAVSRYNVDFDRTSITGYSMGGYGTEKLASQYPDLFAKGFPIVGPQDEKAFAGTLGEDFGTVYNVLRLTENLRHIPLLMWNGLNDEVVPITGVKRYEQHLRDHGYRHELDVFPGYGHFTFALRDEWGRGREFLAGATVERSPPEVTYRAIPATNFPELGLVHDGAYWVSDIGVADGADSGLVDIRSDGFGEAPPDVSNYTGFGTDPAPHEKLGTRWEEPANDPAPRNALDVDLDDTSAVTVWVEEASLDPEKPITLSVESSESATVTLASSVGTAVVEIPDGSTERTVRICDGE